MPGTTIEICIGEHTVNLKIDKPLVLRGSGPGTTLQGSPGSPPTIAILARDVVLERFGIEHLDLDGVAVWAEPGTDPQVREVMVHGGRVSGVAALSDSVMPGSSTPITATGSSTGMPTRLARRIERLLDNAAQREDADDHEGAVELYDDVLAVVPGHGEATALRAMALRQRERNLNKAGRSTSTPRAGRVEIVVDAARGGSLAKAIRGAKVGSVVRVLPGTYRESLTVERAIEIVGDGPPGSVVVETTGAACILSTATGARVKGLTLRQMGGGDWFGIDIAAGSLTVIECDITSKSLACVAVHNGATGNLLTNRIHDGESNGVSVYDNGSGLFERNDIFGNAAAGIMVMEDGNPTVRNNRIHDGKAAGIYVHSKGAGVFEDNAIRAHVGVGVHVRNAVAPVFRGNRISGNLYEGFWVSDGGGGTFEDNDLRGNKRGAWDLANDSRALVIRRKNRES